MWLIDPSTIFTHWEGIVASLALFVTIITLRRDVNSRRLDLLNDVFRSIGELNQSIAEYNPSDRDKDRTSDDMEILLKEKLKEYEYLCFLINRKKTSEKLVFELGGPDMKKMYERYENRYITSKDYPEFIEVIERWEHTPPKGICSRVKSWLIRSFPF